MKQPNTDIVAEIYLTVASLLFEHHRQLLVTVPYIILKVQKVTTLIPQD